MSKALVFLADGFEEVEAVSIIDVLRRGNVEVSTASVTSSRTVHGAHGIDLLADCLFTPESILAESWDAVALPGGMGCMTALRDSNAVKCFLREMEAQGKLVAAVCASPAVLGAAGLLKNRRFCCYPGIESMISEGTYVPDVPVVRDGPILTGTGPATALEFAFNLLEALHGKAKRKALSEGMLWGQGGERKHRPIVSSLAYILSPDHTQTLLVHRTFREEDENLGKYNGIGGKIERNESVAECMKREILEETGLTVTSMHLRGTLTWMDFGPYREDWLAFVYLVDGTEGTPYSKNEEGTLSWKPVASLEELPMWKGDRLFLPLVFDGDPRPFSGFMRYEGDDPAEWRVTR